MSTASWVVLVGLAISALVQLAGLIVWGSRLTQRVRTLEAEIEPLKQLSLQVARLEVKQDGLLEQMKDMNASLRWLRAPADYDGPKRL